MWIIYSRGCQDSVCRLQYIFCTIDIHIIFKHYNLYYIFINMYWHVDQYTPRVVGTPIYFIGIKRIKDTVLKRVRVGIIVNGCNLSPHTCSYTVYKRNTFYYRIQCSKLAIVYFPTILIIIRQVLYIDFESLKYNHLSRTNYSC